MCNSFDTNKNLVGINPKCEYDDFEDNEILKTKFICSTHFWAVAWNIKNWEYNIEEQ